MTITDILTHYGPLGFGWIAAVFLFKENRSITDKYHKMSESSIKVKLELAQTLKELSEVIKKGFGDA